jgi:hypothetical protein
MGAKSMMGGPAQAISSTLAAKADMVLKTAGLWNAEVLIMDADPNELAVEVLWTSSIASLISRPDAAS